MTVDKLCARVAELLRTYPPATTDASVFHRAQFDAGLAWVHFPEGLGGLGLARDLQDVVDTELRAVGAPVNPAGHVGIGVGMAAPTILAFGTPEQRSRYLRPLWLGEEVWCQLFSEPGAGSDLAAVATRAVREGGHWVVNGQKVWTSSAHVARFAILLARTDPEVPKHRGLSYFILDMSAPGVEVRPLRQITGEAEFNEVFLTDVRMPDTARLGAVGDGWKVANATLSSERVAIGGDQARRESGMISKVAELWREHPEVRGAAVHDRVMERWVAAEVFRLTGARLRQRLATGAPGFEGAAMKVMFADLAQSISLLELELDPDAALLYDDWALVRPASVDFLSRGPGYRYLRAKGNSIEGGTSEVLRTIVAERVLGLPGEARVDKDVPWKKVPR
ncbi:acyl-CoA dehydrogenase family protein [Streptomyces luteolus]|uniref:Acyl-CoA dehydrogenase family protein n=1 Tax=Streptomyces luteolus TaxID=3043615 RepID=A0ABT6SS27_9ACTN|nr:acyl-CoA dehydrogenase family protein [Streptomyces sp. B-S-A12]MDI3418175.1 acyl-CoA dehydrogenase family protein [Streptomyces sp. B-S-A12]